MASIGFNFATNDFRYAVLDGTVNNPNLIEKDKIIYPQGMDIDIRGQILQKLRVIIKTVIL